MNESSKALAAYVVYRDMGEQRSIEAVSRALAKSVPFLKRWSSKYKWVDRAKAHDELIAQKAAAADIKARAEDKERRRLNRLKLADVEHGISYASLKKLKEDQDAGNDFLAKHPYALIQMLDHADKTERLDTGEPTDRTEHGGEVTIRRYIGVNIDDV